MQYAVVRQPPMGINILNLRQSVCVGSRSRVPYIASMVFFVSRPAVWLTGRVSHFTALTVPDVANYLRLATRTCPSNDAQRSLLTMCWVKTQHLTHSRKS